MKSRPKPKAKAGEVGVMFRATQQVRGSIKSVSAWCEMSDIRIDGKIPIEKDIWAWIAASFYMAGKDNKATWVALMEKVAADYAELNNKN